MHRVVKAKVKKEKMDCKTKNIETAKTLSVAAEITQNLEKTNKKLNRLMTELTTE